MNKKTVKEVATELDVTEQRVRQLAADMSLGERVGARMLVFSSKEISRMAARKTLRGPAKKK